MAASRTGLQQLCRRAVQAPTAVVCQAAAPRPPRIVNLHHQQHGSWSPGLQRMSQPCRTSVIAAGRRRRSADPAADDAIPDDEPDLDIDDIMYGVDDPEGEEEEFEFDEEVETPEPPDMEVEQEVLDDFDEGDEGEFEDLGEEGEAEPEGWDAALADFDTAQDAAQPAAAAAEDQPTPPSREELERAAALALVRFDEEDSGGTIEVADAPPDEQYIPRTFEEQIQNLSVQDKEALTKNRQAYASFPMDGIDLLVSETPDGRINLADCFILDRDEELFARPTVQEGIPVEPRMYQLLPWEHTKTGDILKRIDPKVTLMRMYFIGIQDVEPWSVDMESVYSFDCDDCIMRQHQVKRLGDDIVDPVLRIRDDGVFIEDSYRVPATAFVAEGFAGHPEEQYTNPDKAFELRDYIKMGLWPEPEVAPDGSKLTEKRPGDGAGDTQAGYEAKTGIEERPEELELLEEFDDMPDVPAVDMV